MQRRWLMMLGAAALAGVGSPARAGDLVVRTTDEFRRALANARAGQRILLAPGTYGGGHYRSGLRGTATAPIVIASLDPNRPATIQGGGNGIQLSDPVHVELRDLVFTGQTGNGLNLDDGGSSDTPARHIRLRNLVVRDVGPTGNRDGIKLSGVDDFEVIGCTIERWGDGGSGIDMVGCHRGTIRECTFRHGDAAGGSAVQIKGGSSEIAVVKNRFFHAGHRAVNLGGSTGAPYFRPLNAPYEARALRVEGNLFVGSTAPIAFVGVDGAVVRYNTLYRPARWALRILQENTDGKVPCRNGVFTDNLIVFRSGEMVEAVNIGPNTAPQTFQFARNWWYCEDQPARSRVRLPVAEKEGVAGVDPRLRDPAGGDFRLHPDSPARGRGHEAYRG